MIYRTIVLMQKLFITPLCLVILSFGGCDQQQTSEKTKAITTAATAALSHNNIADMTADIAALQSIQSLQATDHIDFRNDLLNVKNQGDQQAIKKHYAQMQAFVQQYDKELNQLSLKSAEADQFRTQLKAFNQLALRYSKLEIQERPDEKTLTELQTQIETSQQQLSSSYSQIEQKVSAAGKPIHK